MRNHSAIVTLTVVALLAATGVARAGQFGVTTGVDYTTGDYGTAESTDVVFVPVTARYDGDRFAFKLTVPYVHITAPEGTIIGPDGRPLDSGEGERRSEGGLGDVVLALGYNVFHGESSGTLLDVTGKYKFGTADETRGLGTGEDDYSVQLDLFQTVGRVTGLATVGHRVYGDPPGIDYDNVWFGSLGITLRLSGALNAGLVYDYREAISPAGDPQREAMLYLAAKTTRDTRLQAYLITGLSDASPDWGGGLMFTAYF